MYLPYEKYYLDLSVSQSNKIFMKWKRITDKFITLETSFYPIDMAVASSKYSRDNAKIIKWLPEITLRYVT